MTLRAQVRALPKTILHLHLEGAIFLESIGSGKTETKYTVVRADYPKPLPFEMRIGAD
jgi:hypothetical protein